MMKKILFSMISLFVGASAFAASTLVSNSNQNKSRNMQIGRSASLKMTPGAKGAGVGVIASNPAKIGARTSVMPGVMPVGISAGISNSRAGNNSVFDNIGNQSGRDGYPLKLWLNDNNVLYGWLINPDKNDQAMSFPGEVFNFNKLFEDRVSSLKFRCNTDTDYLEYTDANGNWTQMSGKCKSKDGDTGADGVPPIIECNKQTGLFQYRYSEKDTWTQMDSSCIASDGVAGAVPAFKCITPGVIIYTYNTDQDFTDYNGFSFWYHPGWEFLYGSKCRIDDDRKYAVYQGMDVYCKENANGEKVLYVNSEETSISCSNEQKDGYSCCYNKVCKDLWNPKSGNYDTIYVDIPCDYSYNYDLDAWDRAYCDSEDHVAIIPQSGTNIERTGISCESFPLHFCHWKTKTFWFMGQDTKKSCEKNQVEFTCDKTDFGYSRLVVKGLENYPMYLGDCKDIVCENNEYVISGNKTGLPCENNTQFEGPGECVGNKTENPDEAYSCMSKYGEFVSYFATYSECYAYCIEPYKNK